jgi:hypothetical protein
MATDKKSHRRVLKAASSFQRGPVSGQRGRETSAPPSGSHRIACPFDEDSGDPELEEAVVRLSESRALATVYSRSRSRGGSRRGQAGGPAARQYLVRIITSSVSLGAIGVSGACR